MDWDYGGSVDDAVMVFASMQGLSLSQSGLVAVSRPGNRYFLVLAKSGSLTIDGGSSVLFERKVQRNVGRDNCFPFGAGDTARLLLLQDLLIQWKEAENTYDPSSIRQYYFPLRLNLCTVG